MTHRMTYGEFPTAAVFLFGLGLGASLDGIVFHQVLQWHHMVSTWYPPTSLENLRLNTRWDGAFQAVAHLFVVTGIALLWRKASMRVLYWSGHMLIGALLYGWGCFNVAEGLVDHALLGMHHLNETVPPSLQRWWDVVFLAWGAAMVMAGRALLRWAERQRRLPRARNAAADRVSA